MKKYKEQIKENIKLPNRKKSIGETIGDVIYLIIIIPLLIITLMVIFQSITKPNEIPNIFGYKLFIILDGKMEETLKYGDLVFTKNINTDNIKEKNIVAFRNAMNTVTIHKIEKIAKAEDDSKVFIMQTQENETEATKKVNEEKIEGILVKRIPKIGIWIIILQKPLVLLVVIIVILIIGLIAYYIAWRLDVRDSKKELENNEQSETEDN